MPYGDPRRAEPRYASLLHGNRGQQLVQRSDEWFARRRSVLLSGSRLSALLYCRTYDALQQLRMEILRLAPAEPFDELAKSRMAWGVEHEMDGVRYALENAPDMLVFEAPFVQHPVQTWLGASPDGLVSWPSRLGADHAVLEVKCCTKRDKATGLTVAYNEFPLYYIPQCLMEMRACECNTCVFVCWAQSGSRAWLLRFDPHLWTLLYLHMVNFLLNDHSSWKEWQRDTRELSAALKRCARAAEPLWLS